MATEYKTTVRQYLDGREPPDPVAPSGDGWTLKHVAAATGGPRSYRMEMNILCALVFYVWEREVVG